MSWRKWEKNFHIRHVISFNAIHISQRISTNGWNKKEKEDNSISLKMLTQDIFTGEEKKIPQTSVMCRMELRENKNLFGVLPLYIGAYRRVNRERLENRDRKAFVCLIYGTLRRGKVSDFPFVLQWTYGRLKIEGRNIIVLKVEEVRYFSRASWSRYPKDKESPWERWKWKKVVNYCCLVSHLSSINTRNLFCLGRDRNKLSHSLPFLCPIKTLWLWSHLLKQ